MAKIDAQTVQRWRGMAADFLSDYGLQCQSILTGRDAWTVAARCGINSEAYRDRSIVDAHIQTALENIFPNATFKDRKVY